MHMEQDADQDSTIGADYMGGVGGMGGMGAMGGMDMRGMGAMGGRMDATPGFMWRAVDMGVSGMGINMRDANMGQGRQGGFNFSEYQGGGEDDDDEYGDYNGGAGDFRMGGMAGIGRMGLGDMGGMGGMGPNGPGGSSWAGGMGGMGGMGVGGRSGKADQYDDEGVRLPDQIISERMLGGGNTFEPLGRADSAEVTWLFPPPRHLSFPGSFQDVRTSFSSLNFIVNCVLML